MRLAVALAVATLAAGPVVACGAGVPEGAPVLSVDTAEAMAADLCLGYVYLLRSETVIGTVLVGDPEIVSVVPVSDRALSVTATGEGSTNIVLASGEGEPFGTLMLTVSPVDGEAPEEDVAVLPVPEAVVTEEPVVEQGPAEEVVPEEPVVAEAEAVPEEPPAPAEDSAEMAALRQELAAALAPQAVESVSIRVYRGTGLTLVECRPECD